MLNKYQTKLIIPASKCDYGPNFSRVAKSFNCHTMLLNCPNERHTGEIGPIFIIKMRNIKKSGKPERNFFDFSVNRPQTLRGQF